MFFPEASNIICVFFVQKNKRAGEIQLAFWGCGGILVFKDSRDLCKDSIVVKIFDVELKIVVPGDVAVLQFAFSEQGRIEIFVILRMWMPTDEGANVDVLAGPVIKHHVDSDVVVANKTYYHKGFFAHIFCVILVRRTFFL